MRQHSFAAGTFVLAALTCLSSITVLAEANSTEKQHSPAAGQGSLKAGQTAKPDAKAPVHAAPLKSAAHPAVRSANAVTGVKWYPIDSGLKIAQQNKQMVVADFYTDWCGWCKRLDETTYKDKQVLSALNKNFVAVKANAEDGGAGQAAAQKLGIAGFPSIVFMQSNGNPVYTVVGYRPANKFIKILDFVVAGKSRQEIEAIDTPN